MRVAAGDRMPFLLGADGRPTRERASVTNAASVCPSSVRGHLGCSHLLAFVSAAAVNTGGGEQTFLPKTRFCGFGPAPRSGVPGPCGSSVFVLSFRWNGHVVSHSRPVSHSRRHAEFQCPRTFAIACSFVFVFPLFFSRSHANGWEATSPWVCGSLCSPHAKTGFHISAGLTKPKAR